MNYDEPTHLDLFSGIGGFAIAARWTGFRTVAFSEVDPYCIRVLAKHWPDVPNLGDVRTADFSSYRGTHLLTGGFPCQPWSVAGQQRGTADDRHLWPSMLNVIRVVRPTWVLGENVAGIIGMEFDRMLTDLEGEGYAVQPLVIPACGVDAKHRRERVWIVAHADHGTRWISVEESAQTQGPLLAPEREESAPKTGSGGSFLADTYLPGSQGHGGLCECSGELPAGESGGSFYCRWLPQSDVGGNSDGLSAELDDWEAGIPRISTGVPDRTQRLKALGNSVVPQLVAQILKPIRKLIAENQ